MRTKEKWSAMLAGKPEIVARHVEIPIKIFEVPDRPVLLIIPLSKTEPFIKVLAKVLAKGLGTRARFEIPDVLPPEFGDDVPEPDSL